MSIDDYMYIDGSKVWGVGSLKGVLNMFKSDVTPCLDCVYKKVLYSNIPLIRGEIAVELEEDVVIKTSGDFLRMIVKGFKVLGDIDAMYVLIPSCQCPFIFYDCYGLAFVLAPQIIVEENVFALDYELYKKMSEYKEMSLKEYLEREMEMSEK